VTPSQLAARLHAVQVVDVRWPNEWEAGRIEGSRHIPQDELDDRLDELDRGRPVVTVCRSGSRSAAAATSLRADGFDAENLDGGLVAWADAGLPLVTGDGAAGQVVDPEPPPDDRPVEQQRLQNELMSVLMAVQDHFGDREPSDDEVRAFLRQRLIDQGRPPAEADEFMAGLDEPG
jgi:rhodanese-related sulfurtransferase